MGVRALMARAIRIWLVLGVAACVAVFVALTTGSMRIAVGEVASVLVHPDASMASDVVHNLRWPRAMAAFATGGLLALAGALMQVLLRNPLADPYVLGLSGGAAVGALLAMLAGLAGALLGAAAFAGALLSMAIVFALAHRDLSGHAPAADADVSSRLLLTGIVLAAGWSALVTLLLTIAPERELRGILFWLMGDLGGATTYVPPFVALVTAVIVLLPQGRALNVMLRGPVVAQSLGVPVTRVRRMLFVIASVATALAVTTAGTIGFVGLIVPHALRLAIGNDQRVLLPASALAGGTLLVLADTLARTVIAPQQLPVGAITAVLGAPVFIALLLRRGAR
ncbi:MAG: iron ABC transporter permease [Casimicrobiaceae bacterium]